jgi:hypothetical protein
VGSFTYQLRPGGADLAGVEGYRVYAGDEPVGKVAVVVDRDGERLLVVESDGLAPGSDRRLVPWEAVEEVDPQELAVRLGVGPGELREEDALGAEGTEDDGADAKRVTDLPELRGYVEPGSGPVSRGTTFLPIVFGTLTGFTLLAALALYTVSRDRWPLALLVLPAAFALATAVSIRRSARRPYHPAD